MPPRPFPFPMGVGVDICQINRIAALLRKESIRNNWVRKVFTRLEWPTVCRRFQRANRSEAESVSYSTQGQDTLPDRTNSTEHNWMLPTLSKHTDILKDETLFWSTIADRRSKLAVLAAHLTGRSAFPIETICAEILI